MRSRQHFLLFCSKAQKNVTVIFFTVTSKICKIYFICLRQWDSCLTVYVFYGQRPSRGPTVQERINKYLASRKTPGPHQKSVCLALPSLLFFIFAKYNFANSIITYYQGNASVLDIFFSFSLPFLCSLYTSNSPDCFFSRHNLTFCTFFYDQLF